MEYNDLKEQNSKKTSIIDVQGSDKVLELVN